MDRWQHIELQSLKHALSQQCVLGKSPDPKVVRSTISFFDNSKIPANLSWHSFPLCTIKGTFVLWFLYLFLATTWFHGREQLVPYRQWACFISLALAYPATPDPHLKHRYSLRSPLVPERVLTEEHTCTELPKSVPISGRVSGPPTPGPGKLYHQWPPELPSLSFWLGVRDPKDLCRASMFPAGFSILPIPMVDPAL